ncbi:MAG: hypothetical protein ACTSV3_04700, partial [Candidatus Thorarchaeota archaeon]
MISNDPFELIEQYLERVRIYLPMDSEDTIIELQTHLIEEAERIGNGTMTTGSALMAIERMGDPKSVANEYTGSGVKVGIVPAEYVVPLSRVAVVLVAIVLSLTVGFYLTGVTLTGLFGADVQNWPLTIPLMIGINLIIAFIIIGVILVFDREKPPTEKTVLESILGVGVQGLRPKERLDTAGDFVMGILWGIILMLPGVVVMYTDSFERIYMGIVVFLFLGAFRGALFYVGGENNLNLTVETILSLLWIAIASVIVATNIGFPLDSLYMYDGSTWRLESFATLFTEDGTQLAPFDGIWAVIIFITVAVAVWRVIVSVMKISVYLRDGKGLWWRGTWGERRRLTKPFWKRSRDSGEGVRKGII